MAINWRQRAPILRLLAAVYAELGEDAFKGRYGRIAKLYGNEATYDAIKAFFAKEIVKLADELRLRSSDSVNECYEVPRTQRSGAVQRPLRLAFDDDDDEDIVVVGEREVQGEERSSQPTKPEIGKRARCEPSHDGSVFDAPSQYTSKGFCAVNSRHLPSATPGPSSRPRRQKLAFEASPERQASPRKRLYSVLEEPNDIPPSFGFLTNRRKHRCALCMTELPSAELLRKHEAMSKLHLANLKDPVVVSKGCVTLAQVASISDSPARQRSRLEPEPLHIGGFDGRAGSATGQLFDPTRQSSTPYGTSGTTETEDEQDVTLDTIHVAEPKSHRQANDITHSRNSEIGPAPNIEVVHPFTMNNGKRRAQTVPRDDHPAKSGTSTLPNVPRDSPAQPKAGNAAAAINRAGRHTSPTSVAPTLLAQLLLSSGMELLAKKCIEEHPELSAGFFKCVQEMQGSGSTQ